MNKNAPIQNTNCVKKLSTLKLYSSETEMKNEWNVNFRQNTCCVQKVSIVKLYLPG